MNTFTCDYCGATFEDGIDAGHHEQDHRVLVVVSTAASPQQLLGAYMGTEEDTVMYDEGGLGSPVGRAPQDCVTIMSLAKWEEIPAQDRGPTAAEFAAAADAHDAWKAARASGEAPTE